MKMLLAITASVLLLASSVMAVTQGNDFAVGPDATGVELYEGVLRPITDGGVSLGDASYQFSDLRVADLTVSDDLTVTDDLTVSGETTITVVAVADISVTTPTAVGQLRFDTNTTDLYIATATATTDSWQKVGSQS